MADGVLAPHGRRPLAELVGPAGLRTIGWFGGSSSAGRTTRRSGQLSPGRQAHLHGVRAGVNAFIASAGDHLPVEFTLTGIRPEPWTPEQLLLRARVSDSLGDARAELRSRAAWWRSAWPRRMARTTDPYGDPDGARRASTSHHHRRGSEALDGDMSATGRAPRAAAVSGVAGAVASIDMGVPENSPGSNNWAMSGKLTRRAMSSWPTIRTATSPILLIATLFHLNAPGWNLIGSTEAPLPGVIPVTTAALPGGSPHRYRSIRCVH